MVIKIGENAFSYCENLSEIINLSKTPQPIDPSVFEDENKNTRILYVPKGSIDVYKTADHWNNFSQIKEICSED